MDVRLPDGTVISNVPDGTTKAQLVEKLRANGYDVSKLATEPSGPSAGERTQAAVGGVNRGIAGIVGLPVDTIENVLNLGLAGAGTVANVAGRPDLAPDLIKGSFGGSEYIAKQMNRGGISTANPRPDDAASRMLHTGGMIAGGSLIPGARPMPTAAAAAGGAVASETMGPEWTGVGAMTPASASQAAAAAKNAIASKVAPNVKTFEEAGTSPTVGQATESNFIRGLENLMAKFPGGVGVMRKFADRQQAEMGARTRTGVSAEDAGRAIERGVGGFMARTKETWKRLDDELAAKVSPDSKFQPTNAVKALDDLTATTPGAEKTTGALINPKLAEIKANLKADLEANGGVMPFEALRSLRSKVGSMLDDSLVTGIPGGELKKLYGALSADLEAAANQAGAGREFTRQANFYRSRMTRVEDILQRVVGSARQPEEIFKAINPTDPDQANKLRATMRSLDPSQRQMVSEAVVNRLGRATPGKQNELGDVFSSETFLTNWNKLSPGAKAQLFPEESMRSNLDSIAKVAANLREGSKQFANPSGTAGAVAPYGLFAMGFTGNLPAAAGLIGSTYVGSKMLTNPNVVNWLAKASTTRPEGMAAHLSRLGVIYNKVDDDTKAELDRFMESMQPK